MKIIHNFCRLFKKDNGAHFTYNIGISFNRVSFILVIISAILALYSYIQPDNTLDFYDDVKASVISTDCQTHVYYDNNRGYKKETYIVYTVKFSGTYSSGGNFTLEQYTSESLYRKYSSMQGKEPQSVTLYRSSLGGDYYISGNDRSEAIREYKKINPSTASGTALSAAFFIILGSFVLLVIGLGEMRKSYKYPRTDVPLTQTELAEKKETDDLMAEFDAAYAKRQAQLKAGIQPDDGMNKALTDGGQIKRIE